MTIEYFLSLLPSHPPKVLKDPGEAVRYIYNNNNKIICIASQQIRVDRQPSTFVCIRDNYVLSYDQRKSLYIPVIVGNDFFFPRLVMVFNMSFSYSFRLIYGRQRIWNVCGQVHPHNLYLSICLSI